MTKDTESRFVGAWGWGWAWELAVNGHRESYWGDENTCAKTRSSW